MKDVHRSHEPTDRLTKLAAAMTSMLDDMPGFGDVKAIVMLQDDVKGGIMLHGYADETDALTDMIVHLQAIFESNGIGMAVVPMGAMGGGKN